MNRASWSIMILCTARVPWDGTQVCTNVPVVAGRDDARHEPWAVDPVFLRNPAQELSEVCGMIRFVREISPAGMG